MLAVGPKQTKVSCVPPSVVGVQAFAHPVVQVSQDGVSPLPPPPPLPPARTSGWEVTKPLLSQSSNNSTVDWLLRVVPSASSGSIVATSCDEVTCDLRPSDSGVLRVGRAVQGLDFWAYHLPNEEVRHTISREHFELRMSSANAALLGEVDSELVENITFVLRVLSSRGACWLNGSLVQGELSARLGDELGIGDRSSTPALVFRLVDGNAISQKAHLSLTPLDVPAAGMKPLLVPMVPLLLRVGRSSQPPEWWELAVPSETLRIAVSREHFSITGTAPARSFESCVLVQGIPAATFVVHSRVGMLLNDRPIGQGQQSVLFLGDVVSILCPPSPGQDAVNPILRFRLELLERNVSSESSPQLAGTPPVLEGVAGVDCVAFRLPPPSPKTTVVHLSSISAKKTPESLLMPPTVDAGNSSLDDVDADEAVNSDGGAAVVRINLSALPSPFVLECVASSGLIERSLADLPYGQRVLQASCLTAELQVGRGVQPLTFWEALLPNDELRNTISRDHFRIALTEDNSIVLTNQSRTGTIVNGARIDTHFAVQLGDLIGVGTIATTTTPAVLFKLRSGFNEESTKLPETVLNATGSCYPAHAIAKESASKARPRGSAHVDAGPSPIGREAAMKR